MRSGLRNAALEATPGGERSARAKTCGGIGGTKTSAAGSLAKRASADGLAALVIVAASADSVPQSYAGIDERTGVGSATSADSALP
jgi:hypothetical protein